MAASKVGESVRKFAPEAVLCWCSGLSQEARYSSSVGGGGGAAIGKAIGSAVLSKQLSHARSVTAVRMPRYPVVAVSAAHVFLFDGPIAKAAPFATLARTQVQLRHRRGPMWRRLDLVVPDAESSRSYTVMFFGLFGNKRLTGVLSELANAPAS